MERHVYFQCQFQGCFYQGRLEQYGHCFPWFQGVSGREACWKVQFPLVPFEQRVKQKERKELRGITDAIAGSLQEKIRMQMGTLNQN